MLRQMVEEGLLPPVAERLPIPEDVYRAEPVDGIGIYGGTIRTTTTTVEGFGDDTLISGYPNPVRSNADATAVVPHIAKSLESSEDATEWTLTLRRGMRWSDGHPFTADDIMFWYEDVLGNDELTPSIGVLWRDGQDVVEIEKLHDYAVLFRFPGPRPFFAEQMVHRGAWDLYVPKHYASQFHVDYADPDELAVLIEDGGFEHWYQLYWYRNSTAWGNPIRSGQPGLTAYVLESLDSDRRIFSRNPYFWKVDPAGNQLPYIDRIETEIVVDLEVVQGMVMSGSVDFVGSNTELASYPLYRRFEADGGYRTVLWETTFGNSVFFMVNMTHENPALRSIFQDVRFRQALSLALDREQINEIIYFGRGEPRQYTVLPQSRYFEQSFADAYADYDPERAAALLDEMGLDQKDREGYRLRPDGERLTFTIEYPVVLTPRTPLTELVIQYWNEIGIDARSREISGELQSQRTRANLMDGTSWEGGRESDILYPIEANFYLVPHGTGWERSNWPLWEQWFISDGAQGEEPPEHIKELNAIWRQVLREPDPDRQVELSKQILAAQAENLWVIGTVGMIPQALIFNQDLRNVPEHGHFGWDTIYGTNRDLELLYFER